MKWASLLILPLVALMVAAEDDYTDYPDEVVCPDEDDIFPCYCDPYSFVPLITCDKLYDLEKVKAILNNTKSSNFSFEFSNSRLGDIPSDLFQGQFSTRLDFHYCQIGSFGDRPFSGLENTLESVTILGSIDKNRKELQTFPLGHLKKLKNVMFQANDIKRVGNGWFQDGPSSLEELNLESNDIEELDDKAFASLVNLEQLWLEFNNIQIISRSMFPKPAKKLELFQISWNGIKTLPKDLFTEMPSLRVVSFSGNELTTLDEEVWGDIWPQLEIVYVGGNEIVCDESIKWIYKTKLPAEFVGACHGDNKLEGRYLDDLTLEDFE